MINYNKNELINTTLDKYYETFSHMLDTNDYVEEKYEEDIFLGKFGYSPSWLGYKKTALVGDRYSILVVTSNSFPEHYVNILIEIDDKVIVYDTYDGNIKNKTSSEIIKQNDITYYIPN